MTLRTRCSIAAAVILAALSLHCSDDTAVYTPAKDTRMIRIYLTEQTGTLNTYSINVLDPNLFERIDDLGPDDFDIRTCAREYYDFYFSTVLGEPLDIDPRDRLPAPLYVTINCVDVGSMPDTGDNPPRWEDTGNNIDAVTVATYDGTLFGRAVARVRYGGCDQPLTENGWPADNALGVPDGIVTHLGGGFSSITIRIDDILRGTLSIFERSNTPPVMIVHGIPNLDTRLFEKLPELTQLSNDIVTADCELYDLYFSDADGVPLNYSLRLDLPDPLYVTIDCLNLNCDTLEPDSTALWSDTDSCIDALRLSFGGWHRFAHAVVRVSYGSCGQPPAANDWPAENMLGIPDGQFSRMGGGFSSVTVQLADTTS